MTDDVLCDGCGRAFDSHDDFDRCFCGVELCLECFDEHAQSCFEECPDD